MALQNITPQYQAEERTAQFRLHPVPIQNGLSETGKMLTDAGQGLQKASFGLMLGLKRQNKELQDREDALALAEAKNGYSTGMAKKMSGYWERSGANADGLTKQFETDSGAEFNRWQQGLNPNLAREFKIWADQQYLSGWQRVQGYELSNVKGAQVAIGKQNVDNSIGAYSVTGNYLDLNAAIEAQGNVYSLTNGEVQDAYEALRKDNEAPDDARLNPEERARIEGRVKAYEQAMQNVVDMAVGRRMQYLLEQGDVYGATRYYNSIGTEVPNVSDEARASMWIPLEKAQNGLEDQFYANYAITSFVNQAGYESQGGRFRTTAQDQAMQAEISRLITTGDARDRRRAELIQRQYSMLTTQQASNMAEGLTNVTHDLFRNPLDLDAYASDLSVLENRLAIMPPSALRTQVEDIYNKYKAAYIDAVSKKSNEAKQAERARISDLRSNEVRKGEVSLLKMKLGKGTRGKYSIKGADGKPVTFDLDDEAQFEQLLLCASYRFGGFLLDEDVAVLRDMYKKKGSPERAESCIRVMNMMNRINKTDRWTQGLVSVALPDLVDDVMEKLYLYSSSGVSKDYVDKSINDYILIRLSETRKEAGFWSADVTLAKWADMGFDSAGNWDQAYDQRIFGTFDQTDEQFAQYNTAMLRHTFSTEGGHPDTFMEEQNNLVRLNTPRLRDRVRRAELDAAAAAHGLDMRQREQGRGANIRNYQYDPYYSEAMGIE